ncbi:MAG TPA: hypothetical protein DIT07_15875 [Sphingobacteriaceae bacterium]|nr:hypothetical protein [Sphingobacteriaceae bacterium]
MKRHPSLTPLSREHHSALILARSLQKDTPAYKGMSSDTEGKAKAALAFYEEEIIQHFEEEEKILELIKGINPMIDLLAETILHDHEELHASFQAINNSQDIKTHLDELGKALETHIRTEERQLFPLIQEACNEEMMAVIDKSLSSGKPKNS